MRALYFFHLNSAHIPVATIWESGNRLPTCGVAREQYTCTFCRRGLRLDSCSAARMMRPPIECPMSDSFVLEFGRSNVGWCSV